MGIREKILNFISDAISNNNSYNPKIVGRKIGEEIERIFIDQNIINNGGAISIKIDDIKKRIPTYSTGNGHSALRDGSEGGGQIGYLIYKYNVEKIYENPNNKNSALIEIIIRKK